MQYRIHIRELRDRIKVEVPSGYRIRSLKAKMITRPPKYEKDIEIWFKVANQLFPRIFKQSDDFWKQFISIKYFKPSQCYIATKTLGSEPVGICGYQRLNNFDPEGAVMIYTGVLEGHRKKHLFKTMVDMCCNQLIDTGYKQFYVIPAKGELHSRIYQNLGFKPMSEEYTRKYTKCIQRDLEKIFKPIITDAEQFKC